MSLKILHINTSHRGGAGIAALRLCNAQQAVGMKAGFISKTKTLNFDGQEIKDSFFEYAKPSSLQKLKNKMTPSHFQKITKEFKDKTQSLECEVLTIPFSTYSLEKHPLVQQADILHLHWVGGIITYDTFFERVHLPIVWTLHDMNPFKGIFHYQGDEDSHPEAAAYNQHMLGVKKDALQEIKNGAIVSPSPWLLDEAKKSGVFSHFQQQKVIANGVDETFFTPHKKDVSRETFGIANGEFVLLFVAGDLDCDRKGFALLQSALQQIEMPITLMTIGKGTVEVANKQVKIVPLGFLTDVSLMAKAYTSADAFVLPSKEDNLPNTMLESLACGTPVISFPVGGMATHITTDNGVLAKEVSADALVEAIKQFQLQKEQFDAEQIQNYAREHFLFSKQVKEYQAVYNTVL